MRSTTYKPWAICAVLHGAKPQIFGPYLTRSEAESQARFYQRRIPQGVFNVFYLEPGDYDPCSRIAYLMKIETKSKLPQKGDL
jgi:hypothetical protein